MIIETKGKKVIRQMIVISPEELRKIADEIENQYLQTCKNLGVKPTKKGKESMAFILNKTKFTDQQDGKKYFCIDTWRFQ